MLVGTLVYPQAYLIIPVKRLPINTDRGCDLKFLPYGKRTYECSVYMKIASSEIKGTEALILDSPEVNK